MQRLLMFGLHFMISTTIMGIFVTATLSSGHGTARPILIAALAGFVLSLPVSWFVTRKITRISSRCEQARIAFPGAQLPRADGP